MKRKLRIKRYQGGGLNYLNSDPQGAYAPKIGGMVGAGYYGYQMSQSPTRPGEQAYNTTMGTVSQAGPIGGVIGGVTAIGDAIGKPIRAHAESVDPNTGGYANLGRARRTAVVGGLFNPLKALIERPNYKKQDKEMRYAKQVSDWNQSLADSEIMRQQTPGYYYAPTFRSGGRYSMRDHMFGNAELEDEEIFRTPDGSMEKVNGRTHAQGGEVYNLPENTEILGRNIAPNGKSYKENGDRLIRKFNKYNKILDNRPTRLAEKTAIMMLDKVQADYTNLMNMQEMEKDYFTPEEAMEFACGGIYKGGGWIKKAAESIKRRGTKGKCTPITKPGCTGRARALALTFKKIARKRKKHEDGGIFMYPTGGETESRSSFYFPETENNLLNPYRTKLTSYGSIDNPQLYADMEEDPLSYISRYGTILLGSDVGKATRSKDFEKFIHNVNRKYSKQIGSYYDPYSASLRYLYPDLNKDAYKKLKDYYESLDEEDKSKSGVRYLGGSVYGVGQTKKYASGGSLPSWLYEARGRAMERKGYMPKYQYGSVTGDDDNLYLNKQPKYRGYISKQDARTARGFFGSDFGDVVETRQGVPSTLKPVGVGRYGMPNPIKGTSGAFQMVPTSEYEEAIRPGTERTRFIEDVKDPWYTRALEAVGQYSPIAYNLYQGMFGKPEHMRAEDYYNPYESQVMGLMRGRRYDIDPELEANRLATANYYRAMREGAPSSGRYLSGLQAGQISRMRADAEAIARKQNIDNQYLAEEAGMLGGFGQQRAETRFRVDDINAANRAAQRAYVPTALSQLSQQAQTNKFMREKERLMRNKALRDEERRAIMEEYFKGYNFNI